MGKVMSGDGTVTNVPNHVPRETKENKDHKVAESTSNPASAPPGELEKPKPEKVEKAVAADAKAEVMEEAGFAPDDKVPAELKEKIQKRINAKHRAMVEAQEAADEAERFAENQYNERVLAEKRAEAAERRAQELETKTAPKKQELTEPDERDPIYFENGQFDWKKFAKALSQYETKKALAEAEAARKAEQETEERAVSETRIKQNVQKAREAHPDFDQVMKSVPPEADQVPQWVLNYLGESNESGFVAYHLAKHPEESQRIAKMKPILGLAELGKLEAKLVADRTPVKEEPKAPVTSQRGGAPPPIVPLESGSASINTDPAKMSYKELRAFERNRRMNKH
jgi:chemotaxis protein histidine kinase CheA